MFSRTANSVFYVDSDRKMMRADVHRTPALTSEPPVVVFDAAPYVGAINPQTAGGPHFDVSKDGRFVMVKREQSGGSGQPTPRVVFVTNWLKDMTARAPAK